MLKIEYLTELEMFVMARLEVVALARPRPKIVFISGMLLLLNNVMTFACFALLE